jgi:C1A family cysteine protease
MKKSIMCLCLLLMLTAAKASGDTAGTLAPVNPAFFDYMKKKESGTLAVLTEDGHKLGGMPASVEPNFDALLSTPRAQAAITDPVYDLRTLGLVTPVKDQDACGSCWIFSTMGAIEGRWKKMGLADFDLSENNLMNCVGFLSDPCMGGGSIIMSAAYLTRKSGPVSEADDPYVAANGICKDNLTEQAYITDLRLLPNDMNSIKQAIIDYGSLSMAFFWDPAFYNSSDYTYYYTGTSTNHVVVLAGWDDTKVTAGGTGAWIVKNSWGTGWGDGGYFYISYNDTTVNQGVGYFPERLAYDPGSKLYYYDTVGWIGNYGFGNSIAYGLTKFTATRSEYLYKVGTYVVGSNATIDIEIYGHFDGTNLSALSGSLTGQSCTLPGYYTFTLPSPVSLTNGDNFYIKVKYTTPSYTYPIPIEAAYSGHSNPVIETNKNWISMDGLTWYAFGGGTTAPYDLCIKGYTSTASPPTTTSTIGGTTTTTTIPGTTTSVIPSTTTSTGGGSTTTTAPGGATTTTSVSSSSTTTSIAATTTTTTTGGGCPAKKVLGADNPKLENLRDFRDSSLAQSAVGRKAIQIYYTNAGSINAALDRSPALRAAARSVLEVIAPMAGRKEE